MSSSPTDHGDGLGAPPGPPEPLPRLSRAPVIVTVIFFAVAVTLVVVGAQLSLQPAPSFAIAEPGTAQRPRPINVIMRDYRFDPTPVVLVPGETVRITVFNAGMVDHEMTLGDALVQRAWSEANAAATPPALFQTAPPASVPAGTGGVRVLLASGRQQVVDFAVPQDGELLLLCHLSGHIERGMVGRVELRPTLDVPGSPALRGTPAGPSAG